MKPLLFGLFASMALQAGGQLPTDPYEAERIIAVRAHKPGQGFKLVDKRDGALSFSFYNTIRYLNQQGFDDTYTDHFGRTRFIKKRNDLQFQKVTLYFKGWLFTPKLRYMAYVWTSNVSQGQLAQVVIAGNLQYQVKKFLDVGLGIGGLPTSRSLIGNWPVWLRQDARPMAEEFFRGSYTTGVWAQGEIRPGFYYKTMLGNNLSQLGIDAGQLDSGFDTWSSALWWTTNQFGRAAPFGDFERHKAVSSLLGLSFTRSNETAQSQPGEDAPENSQIRLSDGTNVFALHALNDSTTITAAKYEMLAANGGLKYRGASLDAEYFLRWISKIKNTGHLPVDHFFDQGYSVQASYMLVKKTLQLYGVGSYIMGEYGKPSEINIGLNYFPFRNQVLRINTEFISTHHSPVGYLSFPTTQGANGTAFMLNLELFY